LGTILIIKCAIVVTVDVYIFVINCL
jgi:hypothetical protein